MPSRSHSQPQISVIIPAYNTAPYIGTALDSVFRQTFREYEVIVVNDGSPDTEALEKALEPYMDRIVYIRQENQGVSAARNTGIRAAHAPLVAMLDSDDAWMPEYLEAQVAVLREDPTITLVYPNAVYFGDGDAAGREFMDLCPSAGKVTFESLLNQRCNVMTSVAARRRDILQAGLYDETLPSAEDFDLWLRLILRGGRIVYQRRPLVWYRQRGGSLTSDMVRHLGQVLQVVDKTRAYPGLTAAQLQALERAYTRFRAGLRFLQGKQSLLSGDTVATRTAWSEANGYLRSRKLALALWFLKFSPRAAAGAYHIWRMFGAAGRRAA